VIGLIRSELLKLRTTNVWWAMLLGVAGFTALALLVNILQADYFLDNPEQAVQSGPGDGQVADQQQQQQAALAGNVAALATNVYTSGQFFGVLLVMIFGILIVTNEFRHKTATSTFLATPRRTRVIGAKLVTAIVWGAVFCLVTAIIAIPVGLIYFGGKGVGTEITNGDVIKALLLNVLAFGIWAIFGLGLGTLLKNQVVSIVVALVLYFVQLAVGVVLMVLALQFDAQWILDIQYWLPGGASTVMVSPIQLPGVPPWWAGALALLGYGTVAAAVGTLITTRRDIC
jgi:ABC-type transport system involved in multi-copper enzyme maturation permease subunit